MLSIFEENLLLPCGDKKKTHVVLLKFSQFLRYENTDTLKKYFFDIVFGGINFKMRQFLVDPQMAQT